MSDDAFADKIYINYHASFRIEKAIPYQKLMQRRPSSIVEMMHHKTSTMFVEVRIRVMIDSQRQRLTLMEKNDMAAITSGLRAAALSACAALSLAGFVSLATPAQAFPTTSAGLSSADRGIDVVQYSGAGARRLPPGRHYARRAGLYTCGATNTHTHLNRQACGGNNKMQTYAR